MEFDDIFGMICAWLLVAAAFALLFVLTACPATSIGG